jgi:DNA-binding NarL/FixJ family response regulator
LSAQTATNASRSDSLAASPCHDSGGGFCFSHCYSGGAMQQIRVLVADDNPQFGVLLGRFVTSHSDMLVVGVAKGGHEVVSMAESLEPDLVLMDLYMPDMDGFEATRLLGQAHPEVKVVALTAHRSEDNRRRSLEAGASAFIPKLRVDTDLIEVIRDLAAAKQREQRGGATVEPDGTSGPGS